jgi:hypothetical protein
MEFNGSGSDTSERRILEIKINKVRNDKEPKSNHDRASTPLHSTPVIDSNRLASKEGRKEGRKQTTERALSRSDAIQLNSIHAF